MPTFAAADGTVTGISDAIALASDGDTVTIPDGDWSWTSSSGAALTISKAITLQGAGVGNTILRDSTSTSNGYMLAWNTKAGFTSRMTGIEFALGARTTQQFNGVIVLNGFGNTDVVDDRRMRVDHCKFDHLWGVSIQVSTCYGVIDHNEFLCTATSIPIYTFTPNQYSYSDARWAETPQFGTEYFMFIENNTFTQDAVGFHYGIHDGYGGSRIVFRYNTVTKGHFTFHGTDSGGRARGGRAAEIYRNTFTGSDNGEDICHFRSGTVLVHNNTVTGYRTTPKITLTAYRGNSAFFPWQIADGHNDWDVNEAGGPFETGTATAGGGSAVQTVTVAGAGWTPNEWAGYSITKVNSANCIQITSATYTGGTVNSRLVTFTTAIPHGYTLSPLTLVSVRGSTEFNYDLTGYVSSPTTDTFVLLTQGTPTSPAPGTLYTFLGNASALIISNTSDTITYHSSGFGLAFNLRFAAGDNFEIWKVTDAFDMSGRGHDSVSLAGVNYPGVPANTQEDEPCYEWNNTQGAYNIQFNPSEIMRAGEHYVNDTAMPGYVEYTYPHPLVTADEPVPGPVVGDKSRARLRR